jgi:large subunit ribosomal protein L29
MLLTKDIRNMSTPELETKLDNTREELFKLRFQFKTGQLTDYSRLSVTRRTIAQLATVLRERELAEQMRAAAEGEQK